MKFLLNASIDTLPTAANLKRWKKTSCDLCKLCKRRQTTEHILSIVSNLDPKFTVYSDLPGHTAPGGGSIPPELCVTNLKPDILILNKEPKNIHLFELTCPSEKNIEERHTEKSNKFTQCRLHRFYN